MVFEGGAHQQYSKMRLLGQFQACLFLFLFFFMPKKHQNAKQQIFTILEVFVRTKNCCLCCFCLLNFVLLLVYAVTCFCAFKIFSPKKKKKKINRFEIVLITSFYYTTKFLSYLNLNMENIAGGDYTHVNQVEKVLEQKAEVSIMICMFKAINTSWLMDLEFSEICVLKYMGLTLLAFILHGDYHGQQH